MNIIKAVKDQFKITSPSERCMEHAQKVLVPWYMFVLARWREIEAKTEGR
jgi:hypothetical protein